ncbi:hypothetical protein ACLB1E_08425 [Escherichia coli]
MAAKLGLPFIDAIEKVVDRCQAENAAENRFHHQVDGAFVVTLPLDPGKACSVSDIVDSAWNVAT